MLLHADRSNHEAARSDAGDRPFSRYRLTPNVRAEAADRRRLVRDLRVATRDGMLQLHYQPRLALDSGRALGAEALIRWPHRRRGLVPPRVFMPLAERGGQVQHIAAWVLAAACRAAAPWPEPATVSVAVPLGQIVPGTLLSQVAAALDGSGLAPERLEISLTEALLRDTDGDTYLTLSAIRDLGVGVALDDFGHGLASLTMLRRLPLTAMKLDRCMVRDLPASGEDAAIARASIEAGRALGLTIVADGVETEAQRACLADAGCEQGQGHLFGPLLTGEGIVERLEGCP